MAKLRRRSAARLDDGQMALVLGVVGFLGLMAGMIVLWFLADGIYDGRDADSATATTRAGILAVGAAAIAGALAAAGLLQTQRANDREHKALEEERFLNAVTQLRAKEEDGRLSGIYALQRIGLTSDTYLSDVVDALCRFLRDHRTRPKDDGAEALQNYRSPRDVQEALTALGRVYKPDSESRIDLQGAHLERADFHRANLTRAGLSGAYLSGADLHGVDLTHADLRQVHLITAILHRANMSHADLSGAHLSGADLRGVDLRAAKLSEAELNMAADMSGADLRGADLRGADLRSATLLEVKLRAANLSGADLQKVKLSNVDLRKAALNGANLREAGLKNANLSGLRLHDMEKGGADLRDAELELADLSGTDLREANLRGASTMMAKLGGADLREADLRGVDLSGVIGVTRDQLEAAWGNEQTQPPEGLERPQRWIPRSSASGEAAPGTRGANG